MLKERVLAASVRRTWTVSFFADPADGSGFVEKRLPTGTLSAAE